MKMTQLKKLLSVILCIVLIAAMALITTGCSNSSDQEGGSTNNENVEKPAVSDTSEEGEGIGNDDGEDTSSNSEDGVKTLGEGAKSFDFTVVELNGKETKFKIKTDKNTVGEALIDVNLVEGEEGPYGLYVKKVNGIIADYDKDKTYWAFYVDGEYAMTGVEKTNIEEGKQYAFKVSK